MHPTTSSIPHCDGGPLKRPRFDLGHDMQSYVSRDTRTIGSNSGMYLRRVQTPSLPSKGVGRFNGVGGMGRPGGHNLYMPGVGVVFPPDFGRNGTRAIGFGQQDLAGWPSRERLPLPPDVSSTLLDFLLIAQ
ncbi:unnamed protein product [Eruca vesicaria subsp. sativa]|uniref:Uncharacterized protein n=1 Tax=Eruca vesicaria subsp. sativa TaxID=29727 RepID=A0ABC8KFP7_ERUVS|nr:unnamed protein product [Eruca vesicaria subsp. sativa]